MANDEGRYNALCGLFQQIEEFASREYQLRVWVEGKGPEVSSYCEAFETLFDYQIDYFSNLEVGRYDLSGPLIDSLRGFLNTINSFTDRWLPSETADFEVINLPQWESVCSDARNVLIESSSWVAAHCKYDGGQSVGIDCASS